MTAQKMTRIRLPGLSGGAGLMDYGELSHAEMVEKIRDHARHNKANADAILAAADEDFEVVILRGVHVQYFVRNVLPEPTP